MLLFCLCTLAYIHPLSFVRLFNPGSRQPLPVSVGELKPLPTGLVCDYAPHTERAEQYNVTPTLSV